MILTKFASLACNGSCHFDNFNAFSDYNVINVTTILIECHYWQFLMTCQLFKTRSTATIILTWGDRNQSILHREWNNAMGNWKGTFSSKGVARLTLYVRKTSHCSDTWRSEYISANIKHILSFHYILILRWQRLLKSFFAVNTNILILHCQNNIATDVLSSQRNMASAEMALTRRYRNILVSALRE